MERNASISMSLHPSNGQQIPRSLCCAELSWIGVLWFADSPGCFWIFSWKAFSFWFSVSCFFQLPVDPMKFVLCRAYSWIGVLCFADPLCRFWIFTCIVCHRLIPTFRQGLSGCMVFRLYLLSSFHQVRACRSSALTLVSQLGAMSISALSQS